MKDIHIEHDNTTGITRLVVIPIGDIKYAVRLSEHDVNELIYTLIQTLPNGFEFNTQMIAY